MALRVPVLSSFAAVPGQPPGTVAAPVSTGEPILDALITVGQGQLNRFQDRQDLKTAIKLAAFQQRALNDVAATNAARETAARGFGPVAASGGAGSPSLNPLLIAGGIAALVGVVILIRG